MTAVFLGILSFITFAILIGILDRFLEPIFYVALVAIVLLGLHGIGTLVLEVMK